MRYLLILLCVTITVAGPQSSMGSLRLQLTTATKQPLQNAAVRVRFETSNPVQYPLESQLTTDNSGSIRFQELPAASVRIHLETIGFDDYSTDVTIKAGETITVAAQLEQVEELPFERLSDEQAQTFVQACKQSEFRNAPLNRNSFENKQQWTAFWSELKLAAPSVDFKKQRVIALIARTGDSGVRPKTRRITYNPTRKVIRVRREFPAVQPNFRLPIITCTAEFLLIPPRAGDVIYR